ncbi:1-phosphatidylinositol 3-phosphate 5-kinase FAB1 [Phytophthora citrophthora]|uniref:1-phosphatidylinositol 3-phosphate 5-kinase FAB1 n=1 Tax=Phytophthora citrophthora TaxID=4793 RepID=A0AAD9LMT3_9STRA|nr:1-phosphatidylinositol 3-phosphate 5-kinase FAB1 [Phytophthora citrophthora]
MNSHHADKQAAAPSARILERVREDATDLALLATVTTHDWKLLSDKNGTQMYEMTGESLSNKVSTVRTFGKCGGGHPSEFYLVRAATTVRADVNTMLDVLRTSTSEDFRVIMKKIFDKQFESGAVVDSLSCTTPPPYAPSPDSARGREGWQLFSEDDGYSANWITLRSFTKLGGLDGHRDFTMICYQDVFERAYISDKLTRVGRRAARDLHRPQPVAGSRLIGVHTFSSMNFKDIPELPKSSKTDRLHFRNSGVIVEEVVQEDSNGPMVRVSLLLSLMPSKLVLKEVSQSPRMRVAVAAGHEVAKKFRKWLQTLALGVSHFTDAAKPAVTMQHLSKMTWTESDHCCLCLKTFRTYRRRHHCRFCGEAVCGSCSGFIDMRAFEVNYEKSEGDSDSITVGHRKLDVRMASDGSGRSLGSENTSQKDDTEEFLDTRGCNTCVSELQMNLTMLGHAQGRNDLSLDSNSSSGSLSQLVNAHSKHKNTDPDENYSSVHGPPPPYPGRDNNYERDQVMPMRAGDYQLYEQYTGQKMSFSTISSSSFSGLSQDDKLEPHSSNWAEFMGKPPPVSTSKSSNHTPSSYSTSDASLSAFLARDPDILSLNGLTISPGGSVMTNMDDDEYSDLAYKRSSQASGNRASYATTAATNEGSNHSQFNFSNMTTQEMQTTERLIREANSRGNMHVNGRPPLNTRRHQPRYQPEYEKNPLEIANKKNYHISPRSSAHSQTSSYSSSSANSDMIQLNMPTRSSRTPNESEFVIFDENRRGRTPTRTESAKDMIPLKL